MNKPLLLGMSAASVWVAALAVIVMTVPWDRITGFVQADYDRATFLLLAFWALLWLAKE